MEHGPIPAPHKSANLHTDHTYAHLILCIRVCMSVCMYVYMGSHMSTCSLISDRDKVMRPLLKANVVCDKTPIHSKPFSWQSFIFIKQLFSA